MMLLKIYSNIDQAIEGLLNYGRDELVEAVFEDINEIRGVKFLQVFLIDDENIRQDLEGY